jgi:DNA helicase-2/ATP-dependent DNA helicase PcrA
MAAMTAFAIGQGDRESLHRALATFLTACTRGRPPQLAIDLAAGNALPAALEARFMRMEAALRNAASTGGLADIAECAIEAWDPLGITQGSAPWRRAGPVFASQMRVIERQRLLTPEDVVTALGATTDRLRAGALVQRTESTPGTVQLMNFHQTKGREADCIALVYRPGDYLANRSDAEPFEKSSRVLYVALTRARRHVLIVLPPTPHPLVAPFESLA